MRILFDKSAPYGLARYLQGHAVTRAEDRGWGRLENGILLSAAEEAGFDVFFTADKNLRYQQKLSGRKIAIVALGNSPWDLVRLHISDIVAAINAVTPGALVIPQPQPKPRYFTADSIASNSFPASAQRP